VRLSDGVGKAGDEYERQADRVADAVVAGISAEALLGDSDRGKQISGDGMAAVQRLCSGTWTCASDSACTTADVVAQGTSTSWAMVLKLDLEADSAGDVNAMESNVGHAYVEFQESNGTRWTFGFYPGPGPRPDPMFRRTATGCVVHPDTIHASCVDHSQVYTVTQAQYQRALSWAQQACQGTPAYDILSYNCTTFARDLLSQADISLPSIRGRVGSGTLSANADNPYRLHEGLVPTSTLRSDDEIRDWISGHTLSDRRVLSTEEKVRMLNRLLVGWVSEEDLAAIDRICEAATAAESGTLHSILNSRVLGLTDIGQRTRLRMIMSRLQ
jgi:hypothetical protein